MIPGDCIIEARYGGVILGGLMFFIGLIWGLGYGNITKDKRGGE
ncbi:hypothetical protein LCGC14_2514880 [marine sediment metagenome]|uniref:Uncharacterized protein n=1 Tax=marine sediment metagenome TaxID=412755 RepID=A0A0F9DRD9_9ZZZZ